MNDKLLERIRAVHPDGDTDSPIKAVLDDSEINARIHLLLSTLKSTDHYSTLEWQTFGQTAKTQRIAITLKEHPAFSVWRSWGNSEKLAWIKAHGDFYPVLWLSFSRVAPYYDYHFNDWHPRGDSGYLDIKFLSTNYLLWPQHLYEIERLLEELGFCYFSTELARELVPGFTANGYDAVPQDDHRWADDDFEPPAVPAKVWDCLWDY